MVRPLKFRNFVCRSVSIPYLIFYFIYDACATGRAKVWSMLLGSLLRVVERKKQRKGHLKMYVQEKKKKKKRRGRVRKRCGIKHNTGAYGATLCF